MALVAALAGTALAEEATTSAKPVTKKKVKKIATKQINKLAPGLSVASAETANTANSATNAQNATNANALGGIEPSGYLTPGQGDGRYLPASGQIRLNASPMSWQKTSAAPGIDTLPQRPEIGGTGFGGSSAALDDVPVAVAPTLPAVLVGKPLTFEGVNACYNTDAITTLDTVRVNLTTNTNGVGNTSALLIDGTNRGPNEDACRDYTLPTPHVLAPGDDVSLQFSVDYSANAGFFGAGRATFIFQP